jgi:GR25 family glycosyltransferase involved in LPS biosynthesis
MKIFDKVYIISLNTGKKRREHIVGELNSIGWRNYEFIDAIPGSEINKISELIDKEIVSNPFIDPNGLLTKNIIGCALSHKMAYQKFLDDGHDTCLILEDDAMITPIGYKFLLNGFHKKIKNELDKTNWDIFIWGLVGDNIPNYGPIYNNSVLVEYKKYSPDWAAHAYQINRKGAQKLLDNNTPIKYAADVNLETGNCNIFATAYTLIAQKTGDFNRFTADNLAESLTGVIYQEEFKSTTLGSIHNNAPLGGYSSYEIYFGADRSIKYESRKYACNISKDIDVKSVSWETFKDAEGTECKNWCHIHF